MFPQKRIKQCKMKLNPQVCFQLKMLKLCSDCDFLFTDNLTVGKKKECCAAGEFQNFGIQVSTFLPNWHNRWWHSTYLSLQAQELHNIELPKLYRADSKRKKMNCSLLGPLKKSIFLNRCLEINSKTVICASWNEFWNNNFKIP